MYIDSFLNHYFDHIYVVNLKFKVTDRLIIAKHLKDFGINFEIFEATNGYAGEALEKFEEYQKRELGELKRYAEYSERERLKGHAFIDSAGAMGYIYTYLKILKDAKKNKYKRFLILEDDILLSNDFESRFKSFIQNIDDNWKILQLGASQYGWGNIDLETAEEKGFYFPISNADDDYTYGSFAIALDSTVVDELIEAESAFEASFDYLPMGELFERYLGKCFVAYPNIVMPDVAESTIRDKKDQFSHSARMKWKTENFDYPLKKPNISIVITSKDNLKHYSNFSKTKELPFDLRLFFNSCDGLRPLHNVELLNIKENKILPLNKELYLPKSDYSVMIDKEEILAESDIVKFIEYKLGIRERNATPLTGIKSLKRNIQKERISVIVPICKRPKNLKKTLLSVIEQSYHDLELIVVCDNEIDPSFIEETKQLIFSLRNENSSCNITLLEHSASGNLSAARNTGIIYSTGEFICFLNDGDTYLPGRLSKSINKLKTTTKMVGACYCGHINGDSTENDLSNYKAGDLTLEILLHALKKHYLYTSTVTYKREAIQSINGFDESYQHYQDFEFHLRYFEQYTIEHIKEHLVQLGRDLTIPDNQTEDLSMRESKSKFFSQFSYITNSIIEAQNESLKKQEDKLMKEKQLHILLQELSNISFLRQPIEKYKKYKKLMMFFYKL